MGGEIGGGDVKERGEGKENKSTRGGEARGDRGEEEEEYGFCF